MIRVIAIDLDETLIAPDRQIPDANRQALQAAQAAGARIVIVTARGWLRTQDLYAELGLDTPVIVSSGSRIMDGQTGEELLVRHLPLGFAREVVAFCEREDIRVRVYMGNEMLNNREMNEMYNSPKNYGIYAPNLLEDLVEAPYQLFVYGTDPTNKIVERFGTEGEGYVCKVMQYYNRESEVMILHPQSDKGSALEVVCNQWGVSPEEVLALGDSKNDLPMLEWAGVGVAMSWSPDEVKHRADWVTTPGNKAGVAEAIVKYVLQGRTHQQVI
ncbi:MAG TPA: HAD family hydrolase [Bacilli bacterium]|nr:HAD family hydrolase [Bacilli bacterium]